MPIQSMLNVLSTLSVKQKIVFNVCLFLFKNCSWVYLQLKQYGKEHMYKNFLFEYRNQPTEFELLKYLLILPKKNLKNKFL